MDASWMLQVEQISMFMIIPTILSGIFLCYIEKRKTHTFINIAILNWICMNISWMFSEILDKPEFLLMAKSFFIVGVIFIGLAIYFTENIAETFSHFKRFRIKKL
jgi:hypothetical protein